MVGSCEVDWPPRSRLSAGTVSTTCTSIVALLMTRSVSALPRACSMFEQVPSATRSCASRSIAAQAAAASSLGNVPNQASTPGSETQRRSPVEVRARWARWRSRSGEMRATQPPGAPAQGGGVVVQVVVEGGTMAWATSAGASCELVGDDARAVAVEPALGHRGVHPAQPVGVGSGAAVGGHGFAGDRQAHRQLDPTLRLACDAPSTGAARSAASSTTRPGRCRISPRVPSSHQSLSRRAASASAVSCTAVRVLISDWQSPAIVEPLVTTAWLAAVGEGRGHPVRTGQDGRVEPTGRVRDGSRRRLAMTSLR